MKLSKTILLIFILILLIFILLGVQLLFKKNAEKDQPLPSAPIPVFIKPSPAPKFSITSTNISSELINVIDSIEITFNRPVDNETLALKITPEENILPLFDSSLTKLSIKPVNVWNYNTSYTIIISAQTKSEDNNSLDKNYEFTFKTIPYYGI